MTAADIKKQADEAVELIRGTGQVLSLQDRYGPGLDQMSGATVTEQEVRSHRVMILRERTVFARAQFCDARWGQHRRIRLLKEAHTRQFGYRARTASLAS